LMFLLIGIAAGAITGIPIGPANVAVIDAAYRHTLRRAIAVGLGSAVGDTLYAGAGVLGVTPVVQTYPSVLTILYAISGIVLLVYGFLTARSQPVQPAITPTDPGASQATLQRREVWSGFTVGLALIMLNPAAIVTWVIIATSLPAHDNIYEGIAVALGVFLGSWAWFALVAYLTHKGKNVLGDKAQWIPRVIGMGLMIYAVYLLFKAVKIAVA
jgi:threonine/homoserine/homoserine lactone efflux protein